MQVAAELGERTEQAIFTQTEKTRAGAKSTTSMKTKDDSKFRKLYNGLVEKGKEKARPRVRPQVNGDLWTQLMLLYPELTLALDPELVSEGEAGAELLAAVQNGVEHLAQLNELLAYATVVTEADLAATAETQEGTAVTDSPTVITADNKAQTERQPTAILDEMGPEASDMTVQGSGENLSTQHKDSAVRSPEAQPQAELMGTDSEIIPTEVNAQTSATIANTKTTEMAVTTDTFGTAGISETLETSEETKTKEAKTARFTAMMDTLQAEAAATETETMGIVEIAETAKAARQRVSREDAGEDADLTAPYVTAEREPKTEFKLEMTNAKGFRLHGELFSPGVGEAQILEPNSEVTAVPSEPVASQITREDLAAQIVSGARLMVKDGVTKIQLQLEPAELGKLELALVVERDLVAARFVAESQGVQSLIEANLPGLRVALEEAGLQVNLLQVGVQTGTDAQSQNMADGEQPKWNTGWKPSVEMYGAEEQIFGEEAWHGMVNLRV